MPPTPAMISKQRGDANSFSSRTNYVAKHSPAGRVERLCSAAYLYHFKNFSENRGARSGHQLVCRANLNHRSRRRTAHSEPHTLLPTRVTQVPRRFENVTTCAVPVYFERSGSQIETQRHLRSCEELLNYPIAFSSCVLRIVFTRTLG